MYCPQCGTQNIEVANFCRLCGVRIQSPTPSALPQTDLPNYERSLKKLFIGGALLIIATISSASGRHIFGWMFVLGFFFIFNGIKQLSHSKLGCNANGQIALTTPYADVRLTSQPTRHTEYNAPQRSTVVPPSVTERTTRLFDGD
jgi:zinc-ribbon domain